jgi:threonine/homoserine/homoserine lactone efflux protein
MDLQHLIFFIAAGLLLNLIPGPDVLYIVTKALRSGSRAGMVAAFGITAGCFVHIFTAAIGVSALVAASNQAFAALKWAGAAYLVYVGLHMLLAKRVPDNLSAIDLVAYGVRGTGGTGLKSIFFQGFWTNTLNPKVALFFLALVPQFITPDIENKPLAFLLLGLVFNFNGLWVNIGWALVSAWMAQRLGAVQRSMHVLERAAGVMFIGFGLKRALSDNPVT